MFVEDIITACKRAQAKAHYALLRATDMKLSCQRQKLKLPAFL